MSNSYKVEGGSKVDHIGLCGSAFHNSLPSCVCFQVKKPIFILNNSV